MMEIKPSFQEQLNQETEHRIAQMEQADYIFPPRFSQKDYLAWALVVVVCFLLLLLGVRL